MSQAHTLIIEGYWSCYGISLLSDPRSSDKGKPGEILGRKVIGPKVFTDHGSQTTEDPVFVLHYDQIVLQRGDVFRGISLFLLKPSF